MQLAHITDLHLRAAIPGTSSLGGRRSREVLAKFTAALHEVTRRRVDLIAITGDLLDVPHFLVDGITRGFMMPEAEDWLSAVRRDYETIRGLLEKTGIPYAVVPGNHDLPHIFFEVFPERPEFEVGGFRVVSFVDYEHEGHVPRRFGPSRNLFDRVLRDEDPTPQIHLQHYLLNPIGGDYPYYYAEHAFLRRSIEKSGRVRLCLSGHYHEGTDIVASNGVAYAVTPGFCKTPHPWRIYHLEADGVRYEEESSLPSAPAKVVFLDRDGVINDLASYNSGPENMRLIPGSAAAIKRLNARGIKVVVVTSQSCIGLGYVPESVVQMVHERMHALLDREGAFVDAIYFTKGAGAHSILPEGEKLETRKACLVHRAMADLALSGQGAWLVGDRLTDMEAARDSGIVAILVQTGDGVGQAKARGPEDHFPVVEDLSEAVERILSAKEED